MKKQSELVSTTIQDLLPGVIQIIDFAKSKAALFLNAETTLMYWGVGHFINTNLKENNRTKYGRQILATLSQQLTLRYGKGFTYTSLNLPDKQWFADKLHKAMEMAKAIDHNNNKIE
jgi:hypothetical protein